MAMWPIILLAISLATSECAFLSTQLPLTLEATTPQELLGTAKENIATLNGRQALTAVFSRPVIPLGSDFGSETVAVPFKLSCGVPGRLRWATTYIARFDPDIDWPTDLNCSLTWNGDLTTYDGVKFQPPSVTSVKLQTDSLNFIISSVSSKLAEMVTGDLWSAFTPTADDVLPEVPPDGVMQLLFTYPVDWTTLQTTVKVTSAGETVADVAIASVTPCDLPIDQDPIPYLDSTASICAQISLRGFLAPATTYELTLPPGAMYNSVSGPLAEATSAKFGGSRQFHLPLVAYPNQPRTLAVANTTGPRYRRFNLWLLHGLDPSTSLASVQNTISLCYDNGAACTPVSYDLTRLDNGTLQMSVPSLQPHRRYTLSVRAASGVKDGLGLPLRASSNTWWSRDLPDVFQGPAVYGSDAVFGGVNPGAPLSWPFLSRGNTGRFAGYWRLDVTNPRVMAQVFASWPNSLSYPAAFLGPEVETLSASGSSEMSRQQLTLRGADKNVYLVHTCCSTTGRGRQGRTNATQSLSLVAASNLSLSVIQSPGKVTAWVTNLANRAAPVRGSQVNLYRRGGQAYGSPPQAYGSCTTGADGSCTMPSNGESDAVAAVAVYGNQVAMVPTAGWVMQRSVPKYTSSLILDRALVKPGDSLHVSGYIQQQVGDSLKLIDNSTRVKIAIFPNFDASNTSSMVWFPFLNQTVGTVHTTVQVPETAQRATYSVYLQIQDDRLSADTFTVSESRTPTAELELTVPPWAKPGSSIPISVKASSYLGVDLEGANMTLTWTAGSNAHGISYISTNSSGDGEGSIDLGSLPAANSTKERDVVSVTVEWVGPTRERIVKTASITLSPTSQMLKLATLPSLPDLPNVTFLVATTLTSLVDGSEIKDVPIKVTLAPGNDTECGAVGERTCATTTGAFFANFCLLSLPCMGIFHLTACTNGVEADKTCTTVELGRNRSSWQALPWSKHPDLELALAPGDVAPGGEVSVVFSSPWQNAVGLAHWSNGFSQGQTLINQVVKGYNEFKFTADESCVGGCSLVVVLAVGANSYGANGPVVPTSKLLDPRAPFTTSDTIHIDVVEDRTLNITIDLGKTEVPRGSSWVSWNVTVTYPNGTAARDAEVTVIAVDKAILDLLPYPLKDPSREMQISSDDRQEVYLQPGTIPSSTLKAVFDTALRRADLDPWTDVDTTILATPDRRIPTPASVDVTDDEFLSKFSWDMTVFPNRGPSSSYSRDTPLFLGASGPAPVPVATPTPTPSPASALVRVQKDFKTTAVFSVFKTDSAGTGRVTFYTRPENLGTLVVRVYAAAPGAAYGSIEDEVVVRQALSLTASVPASVRVGDVFEAGVIVSRLEGTDNGTINLSLQVGYGALNVTESPYKTLRNFSGVGQREVTFRFLALQVGTASLFFYADSNQGSDALQVMIPVLGQQSPVTVATSFVVRDVSNDPSSSSSWQEGLMLPSAVPGSGSLQVVAGVGYLPAVLAIETSVVRTVTDGPNAAHSLAVMSLIPSLATYGLVVRPSGMWGQISTVDAAAADLAFLTDPQYGLQYLDSKQQGWEVSSCPIVLNAQAIFLTTTDFPTDTPPEQWLDISYFAYQEWHNAIAEELTVGAIAARTATDNGQYDDMNTLAWARLALGPGWAPDKCGPGQDPADPDTPTCGTDAIIADLSIDRLIAQLDLLPIADQVLVGLTLFLSDNYEDLATVLDALQGNLRVQGQTAYVAANEGSATPLPLIYQALALQLLVSTWGSGDQQVAKLAAYVAAGQVAADLSSPSITSMDQITQAFRVTALSQYDRVSSSAAPDLDLKVIVGGKQLLNHTFNAANMMDTVNTTTPWEYLPSPPGNLTVMAEGTGEASVAASLTFVPSTLLAYPTYRGIWVQSLIQLVDPLSKSATGPALATVPLGSLVAVTVQVTSPDDLGLVKLEVLLPGGLEPLDPNVASDAATAASGALSCPLAAALGSTGVPSWWWWPICPAQETFADRVVFQWQYLASGTTTVQLLAVATTAGDFVLPPIKALATQQPEVMGLTAGGSFSVCALPCEALPAAVEGTSRACPDDCNGNGVCNIAAGVCKCSPGFNSLNCQ